MMARPGQEWLNVILGVCFKIEEKLCSINMKMIESKLYGYLICLMYYRPRPMAFFVQ